MVEKRDSLTIYFKDLEDRGIIWPLEICQIKARAGLSYTIKRVAA